MGVIIIFMSLINVLFNGFKFFLNFGKKCFNKILIIMVKIICIYKIL